MLLPHLGPSQHLEQDMLGPDIGIGSMLPHDTQWQPSGEDGRREEAHRLGKKAVSEKNLVQ